jgi:3-oxoacyl-[acyl-carrier-protein] synthase II
MIALGRADVVGVFCFDLVTEFVFSGFSAINALSPGWCRPFDSGRNGLTLGEGASFLVMMSEERARTENKTKLGRIIGWGIANDAAHITAPARDGCGLIQAIRFALDMAELKPEDIGAVNAHGTGTVYNDMMELTAFADVFGDRPLPIHSVKGAIGHTLGAAGGIEVAVALKSLDEQLLPPTVGLKCPESKGIGRVSHEPQLLATDYLLTTNSGFGGINAALILEKGGPV